MALALGCSPEGLLIAFDSGWYRETARSTCFLMGQVAVANQRAHGRELPYTFIFRYALAGYLVALRWMAVGGAKYVKPEKNSQRHRRCTHAFLKGNSQSLQRPFGFVTPQGRLQISADLDVKGLGKLKQMLEQYEQILKLLQ